MTTTSRNTRFQGMTPILPTTIDQEGDIDEASQRRLVHYCLDSGAVAIGHMAFASEFFKLTPPDRRKTIEILIDEVAGRVPVFIGVTAPSERLSIQYAKEAEALGADLIMAMIPYVTIPDAAGARDHLHKVCASVSIPVILQDAPFSAEVLKPEFIAQLAREIDNLRYVKPEGRDFLDKTAKLMQLSEGRLEIMGGFGGKHMIHMLRLGVTSFMTGTEALEIHAAVVRAYLDGDEEKAARIYYGKILPYFVTYDEYPEELLKRMLHLRKLIDCPDALSPRVPKRMSDTEWNQFLWVLDRVGLREPWKPSGGHATDTPSLAQESKPEAFALS